MAEIFQNVLQQNLSDMRGVKNIVDDILFHGKTRKLHDEALESQAPGSLKLESQRREMRFFEERDYILWTEVHSRRHSTRSRKNCEYG